MLPPSLYGEDAAGVKGEVALVAGMRIELVVLEKIRGVAPADVDSLGDEICGGWRGEPRSTLYLNRFGGGGRAAPLWLASKVGA